MWMVYGWPSGMGGDCAKIGKPLLRRRSEVNVEIRRKGEQNERQSDGLKENC